MDMEHIIVDEVGAEIEYSTSAHPSSAIFTGRTNRINRLLDLAEIKRVGTVVDIGCGYGDVSLGLAKEGYSVVGIDIFLPGLRSASRISRNATLEALFLRASAQRLAVKTEAANLVICYNLWEHLRDRRALLGEVRRILQDGGTLLLVVPNKFWIMETHYRLPLLSWFPRTLANGYLRLFRRGKEYDVDCPTWWQLNASLRSAGFRVTNLSLYVLRNFKSLYPSPEYLGDLKYRMGLLMSTFLNALPSWVGRTISNAFSEAFFLVAIKQPSPLRKMADPTAVGVDSHTD